MTFKKHYFLPVYLMLLSISLSAQTFLQVKPIDSLMRTAASRGVFNGTLLVAKHGNIIYHKAWGYASTGKTKVLTKEMLFDIGSISKEFNGVQFSL
jgi:CubicO group peptidase (beta-lactamase class C family)